MDMITLAAARKYVNDTANALGAVKGSPCTIKSITETDDGATVVFSWTGADGVEQTSSTFLPRGPQGLPGEKGEPGAPGKDGSGTVDTFAREQITALTEENAAIKKDVEALKNGEESNIVNLNFDTNQVYRPDRGTFGSAATRVAIESPIPFNSGDKLTVRVGDGEKYGVMTMQKVSSTGDLSTDYEWVNTLGMTWNTEDKTFTSDATQYVFVQVAKSDDSEISPETCTTTAFIEKADMVDGLPMYWISHLNEKNSEIDTAMNAIGGHGDAVLYFTDPHWSSNEKRTPDIARYIRAHTSIKNVFCGGDIANGGNGRDLTGYRDVWNGIPVFTFRGNHDQNPNATDETDIISDEEFYNLILRPIEDKATLDGQLYFHLDNTAQKIRYIFMDSGCAWTNTLDDTQINWFKTCLTELDAGWSALVMQHMVFEGNAKNGDNISISSRGTLLINTINAVWDQLKCNIIGILTGHIHSDYSITESVHGYPIIATSCDNGAAARNDYDPVNPSTVGTVSEQLLDAVCIDTSARTIQCIRIGAGNNRSFTY